LEWELKLTGMIKQLCTFILLAYSISWLIWLPLYSPALGFSTMAPLPFNHALGGLGPLTAGFITNIIFNPRAARQALIKCFAYRPVLYLTIALISPFIIAAISIVISHFINNTPLYFSGMLHNKEFPGYSFVALLLYNIIFFGFGEEAGWRGFALPRLQSRHNALASSLLLTVIWALWHLPLFLYRPGYTSMDPGGVAGWIFSLVTGSILLTWFYNTSRGSILICALFHATIDIPFTSDLPATEITGYIGAIITFWGIFTILIFRPANLSRSPKVTLDDIS
jgi:membrane protease YdiL (CAAX protease family)